MSILRVIGMLSIGLTVLSSGAVYGQNYPTKVIRIVSHLPGGGIDFLARLVAQGITGPLGQPVIVDNRQTSLVGGIVAKSEPDGYTGQEVVGSSPQELADYLKSDIARLAKVIKDAGIRAE